jgi:hypothetical protein
VNANGTTKGLISELTLSPEDRAIIASDKEIFRELLNQYKDQIAHYGNVIYCIPVGLSWKSSRSDELRQTPEMDPNRFLISWLRRHGHFDQSTFPSDLIRLMVIGRK